MIIQRLSNAVSCQLSRPESSQNPSKTVPLFTIGIPEQTIGLDLETGASVSSLFRLDIMKGNIAGQRNSVYCTADDIDYLARQAKYIAEVIGPQLMHLNAKLTFTSNNPLSDVLIVNGEDCKKEQHPLWQISICVVESGGSGFLGKKNLVPQLMIGISLAGLKGDYSIWTSNMLDPLLKMKDAFIQQKEAFSSEIKKLSR